MSKLALKSEKIKMPESFEAVEAKELSQNEQDKISRKLILRWFNGKKFEKLKALQQKVIEASYTEREELKNRIIENTKAELAKHKELTKEEIERRSEKFADDIINVAEGRSDVALVARRYAVQQDEEETFYRVIDGFVNKRNQTEALQKLSKSKEFASLMDNLKANDPANAQRIEMAIKEGDYDGLQKLVEKVSDGKITKSVLNRFLAFGVLGVAHVRKFTPFDSLNGALSYLNNLRQIGHGYALDKAAGDLSIPFPLMLRFAPWTLRELRQMDNIMQRNKHLIEDKSKKTVNDNDRLIFIEHMHNVRMKVEQKVSGDKNFETNFKKALSEYLDSKKGLSDRDKEEIRQAASYEDLRLVQLIEYYYAPGEKRSRWLMKSFTRMPTMVRAYKNVFGEQRLVKATMLRYTYRRVMDRTITTFRLKARNWQMNDILRGIEDIEGKMKGERAGTATAFEDLFHEARTTADKIDVNDITAEKRYLDKKILDQDRMLQKYSILVRRATKVMSDEAKKVIDAGRALEKVQKSAGPGSAFLTKKLNELPHISDQSLAAIGLDKAKRASYSGADLIQAYTRKAVDLKTMEDVTRARFSALAEVIETEVARPVSNAWAGKVEVARGAMGREELRKEIKAVSEKVTPHKLKYRLKTFGLPAIIIGLEGYDLFTGKAKSHEVMWDLAEAAGGFLPILGTALDIRGAIKGTSLSGKKLSTKERWMYVAFAGIGLIADGAWAIGGLGLGIRAGLGGVRAGRRAVKAGHALKEARELGGLKDVAYASELPFFQRQIAKAGSLFDKVRRADSAAETLYARKAIDQARALSKYNSGLDASKETYKVYKIEDIAEMAKKAEKAGDRIQARELRLLEETLGGAKRIDYLKVMKGMKKGIDIPKTFIGRTWLKGKAAFLEIKGWLLSIGIPAKTIQEYERSFDVVEGAKKLKLIETKELTAFIKSKEAERIAALKSYEKYAEQAGDHQKLGKDYAKIVDDLAKSDRKHIRLEGIKNSKEAHLKKLEELKESGRASQTEIDAAKKAFEDAEKTVKESKTRIVELTTAKNEAGAKVAGSGDAAKNWKNDFDKANANLEGIETEIIRKEDKIRAAQETIVSINSNRSIMAMEMESKATQMAKMHDQMSGAASLFQKAGLATGLIWMLTGFNHGPAEQMAIAKKGMEVAEKGGTKAFDYVIMKDHSGRPPIDQMVEGRVEKVRLRQKLGDYVEKAEKRGLKAEEVLARHWNTEEAQELARRQGLYEKVQKLIADKKVVPEQVQHARASIREIATGDSARKLKEKLLG